MPIDHIMRQGQGLFIKEAQQTKYYPKVGNMYLVPKQVFDPGGGAGVGAYEIGNIPSTIRVPHYDGTIYNMEPTQIKWAVEIIKAAAQYPGVDDRAVQAALACAAVESVFRMYANSNVPESYNYPHDLVGSDHDSVGLFQQRPSAGWGSVREIMTDLKYSVFSFFGGQHGPRGGNSPQGYYDKAGYATRDLAEVIQSVQISAHPSRYRHTIKAAQIIMLSVLKRYQSPSNGGGGAGDGRVRIDPLPGHYDANDPAGGYAGGRERAHTGSDWNGLSSGTPVPACMAGTVTHVGFTSWNGNCITVKTSHPENRGLYYAYLHLESRGNVNVGDTVRTGQILGPLGNTGTLSLGAHLHITLSESSGAHDGLGQKYDPYVFLTEGRLRAI